MLQGLYLLWWPRWARCQPSTFWPPVFHDHPLSDSFPRHPGTWLKPPLQHLDLCSLVITVSLWMQAPQKRQCLCHQAIRHTSPVFSATLALLPTSPLSLLSTSPSPSPTPPNLPYFPFSLLPAPPSSLPPPSFTCPLSISLKGQRG